MPLRTLRIVFGLYLVQHFATLLPWGAELFSNRGVMPQAAASPLIHAFPNVLAVCDTPWFVTLLLSIALAASVAFLFGWHARMAAVVIWVRARLPVRTKSINFESSDAVPGVAKLLAYSAIPPNAGPTALANC